MNPRLSYVMVQQKQSEFAYRGERARLAREARAAVSAQRRRSNLGRLIAPRRLGAPAWPQLRSRQVPDRGRSA